MTWQAFTRSADADRTGALELGNGTKCTTRFNNVGVYTAVTAWDDDLWDRLKPGGGLILRRDGDRLCNGPIRTYGYDVDVDDDGQYVTTILVEGVTDEIVLADRIVYPDPALAGDAQTSKTHWTMTGPAEDVMCALVDQQAGPSARTERRTTGLTVAPSQGRGTVVTVAIRYGAPNMLAELQTIARNGGGLGFRVAPTPDGSRQFEVYEPRDRSGDVRFGTNLGNVGPQSYRTGAPTVTDALWGGGGLGTSRTQRAHSATDPESLAWGRRIEVYGDGRDTEDGTLLSDRAAAAVADGAGEVTFDFQPLDSENARFGEHWELGDAVTVYAGPPGGRQVKAFVDLVREVDAELRDDTEDIRAAVGAEGATTGRPKPTVAALLKIRAELQALKGSA